MKDTSKPFDDLYEEFHASISRYLARMVSPAEAEDLAQEVFSKVAKNIDGFEGRAKISTWIYRIATNTALDRLRSPSSRSIEIPMMEDMDSLHFSDGSESNKKDGPLDSVINAEMNECIREQMNKLPQKYRTVMILSSLDELKNREIAEILEISLEAVKMRLHRGRAKLKEILKNECRFYHHPDTGALLCDRKT